MARPPDENCGQTVTTLRLWQRTVGARHPREGTSFAPLRKILPKRKILYPQKADATWRTGASSLGTVATRLLFLLGLIGLFGGLRLRLERLDLDEEHLDGEVFDLRLLGVR